VVWQKCPQTLFQEEKLYISF